MCMCERVVYVYVWDCGKMHNTPKSNGNGSNLAFGGMTGVCGLIVGKYGKFGVYFGVVAN